MHASGRGECTSERTEALFRQRAAEGIGFAFSEELCAKRISRRLPWLDGRKLSAARKDPRNLPKRDLRSHVVDASTDKTYIGISVLERQLLSNADYTSKFETEELGIFERNLRLADHWG